jgi:hypothetical protein
MSFSRLHQVLTACAPPERTTIQAHTELGSLQPDYRFNHNMPHFVVLADGGGSAAKMPPGSVPMLGCMKRDRRDLRVMHCRFASRCGGLRRRRSWPAARLRHILHPDMGGGASAFSGPSSAHRHLPAARNRPDSAATPAFEPPQNAKVKGVLACLRSSPRPGAAARSTCRQHACTLDRNRISCCEFHAHLAVVAGASAAEERAPVPVCMEAA